MRALCFGSLNIDYVYTVPEFVTPGETLAAERLERFSGGKGLNQALALSRAGMEVHMAGAIGPEGRFLLETLDRAEVSTDWVRILPEERTGHAIIQRRTADGQNCILLYGGTNRRIAREQIDETLSAFAAGDLLVLQNEINELPYLMERARERGLRIALNPSPMTADLAPCFPLADVLLLNEVEAAAFLGIGSADGPSLLSGLWQRLPDTEIVLTLGSGGSLYAGQEQVLFQPAFPVEAVDTTAAGDTYTGYFLAACAAGLPPQRAMQRAALAAAIAVSRPGAAPSVPELAEVLEAEARLED